MPECCWTDCREEEDVEQMRKRIQSVSGSREDGKEELVGLWMEEGHIFHFTEGKEEMSKYS